MAYNFRLFKEIFFPRHCNICSKEIDTGCFCASCRSEFVLDKLLYWGNTQIEWQEKKHWDLELKAQELLYSSRMLYKYEGNLKSIIHNLKFEDREELLPLLKEEAVIALIKQGSELKKWLEAYDIISFIPTSKERLERRGFDVPVELFSCLKDLGQEDKFRPELLLRVRSTAPLYKLGPEERKSELAGCFKFNPKCLNSFSGSDNGKGPSILLCDDIVTTYGTVLEAAKVLLEAGAEKVSLLAFTAAKTNW